MHLADLPVVQGNPLGCVVEGRFTLESPRYPGGEPISAEGARISFFMQGAYGGAYLILGELAQEPCGLFSRPGQGHRLMIHLPASIHLERLLLEMSRSPVSPGCRRVEGVELSATDESVYLHGQIPELEIRTQVLENGLGLRFSGEAPSLMKMGPPLAPPTPEPSLADSRIEADIVVPWTFLTLLGSDLASLERTPQRRDERTDTRFDFDRSGLAAIAFDRNSQLAYFPGWLSVPKAPPSKACVSAYITDAMLELTPSATPWAYADGFATGDYGSGPKLTLFGLGYGAWIKMLSGGTTGRIELKGDGLGFVTEAWIAGAVAGRHAISSCSLDLKLSDSELVLNIEGEVDRLLQFSGPPLPPTLGPGFKAGFRIPALFLAARGIDLLSWGRDQHRLLEGTGYR